MTSDQIGEMLMLIVCSTIFLTTLSRALKNRREVQFIEAVALAGLVVVYALLLFDFEPLQSDVVARGQIVRPFAGAYIFSSGIELGNGKLIQWVRRLEHQWNAIFS